MPTDRRELADLIAAAGRDDTARGLIFNAAFEVAREAGRAQAQGEADGEGQGQAAALACDPAGKGKRTDFRAYPVADLLEVLWRVADRADVHFRGVDGVLREIGYRTTVAVLGSMFGSTLLSFGSSPRLLVEQVPAAYRAVLGFGRRQVTWPAPTRALIAYERDFLPVPFHQGVVLAALEGTTAQRPSVAGRFTGFLRLELEVAWS